MSQPITIPKRSPWISQILVIRALFSREVTTRFGQYKLGFLWMLLEPLMSVLVIGLIIGTLAERTVPEIPYPFFLLNGFLMLNLFTGPISSGLTALGSNQGLLVYPNVKLLDPFIARFTFELITTMFSFVLFCVVGMLLGIRISLDQLHIIAASYIIIWLSGCGFGLIGAVAAAYYKELEKIVPVIMRPLLFLSAVLFPISTLSTTIQSYLLLNPLVHTIELCRHAMFPFYRVDGPNLLYPAEFALVVLAIGLTLFHNHRKFLSQR
jgi:capsular polysaccharide transport system permease protein